MPTVPPWPSPYLLLPLKGGAGLRHDSAAECADGRIIYVWVNGSGIHQCHYPNIGELLGANNGAATAGVNIASSLGMAAEPISTVWRSPAGDLFLFVSAMPSGRDVTKVWKSTSGNGESSPGVHDWVLWSTLQDVPQSGFDKDQGERTMGEPYVTGGGRWIITAVEWQEWQGIWTSDDGGVSWTYRHRLGWYIFGGAFGYGLNRNVIVYDGKYWVSGSGNVDPAKGAYSTDGAAWTTFEWPGTNNSDLAQPLYADGSGMQVAFGGVFYGTTQLELTPDPPTTPRANRTTLVSPFPGGLRGILQRIAGHDAYMVEGQILVLQGGWSVGQIRIA